jgi:hypothetical protein
MNEEFDTDINCNKEETERRIEFCMNCENLTVEIVPMCSECRCSISMLGTYKFKTCPIGKW